MADPARMLKEQVQEELKIGESDHVTASRGMGDWPSDRIRRGDPGISVPPLGGNDGDRSSRSPCRCFPTFWSAQHDRCSLDAGVFRSGLDMFVVGLGVAMVGYFVGGWVGRLI